MKTFLNFDLNLIFSNNLCSAKEEVWENPSEHKIISQIGAEIFHKKLFRKTRMFWKFWIKLSQTELPK